MTDAQLVQDYLANGGTITKCPPHTFSSSIIVPWHEQRGEEWQKRLEKNSPFAASRNTMPAGDLFRLVALHGLKRTAAMTGIREETIRERMNKFDLDEAFLMSKDWGK